MTSVLHSGALPRLRPQQVENKKILYLVGVTLTWEESFDQPAKSELTYLVEEGYDEEHVRERVERKFGSLPYVALFISSIKRLDWRARHTLFGMKE